MTTPLPARAASHGAPARRYLNEKVTGVLLEGMKRVAAEQYVCVFFLSFFGEGGGGVFVFGAVLATEGREGLLGVGLIGWCCCRPEDPLRVLGEFLLQRSREVEGGG